MDAPVSNVNLKLLTFIIVSIATNAVVDERRKDEGMPTVGKFTFKIILDYNFSQPLQPVKPTFK